MLRLILFLCSMSLLSCSSNNEIEYVEHIGRSGVMKGIFTDSGLNFVVQKTFSGGATGDTLYKIWSCKRVLQYCRLQAIVDSDDGNYPNILEKNNSIYILTKKSYVVWNFCNRSIKGKNGSMEIILKHT